MVYSLFFIRSGGGGGNSVTRHSLITDSKDDNHNSVELQSIKKNVTY